MDPIIANIACPARFCLGRTPFHRKIAYREDTSTPAMFFRASDGRSLRRSSLKAVLARIIQFRDVPAKRGALPEADSQASIDRVMRPEGDGHDLAHGRIGPLGGRTGSVAGGMNPAWIRTDIELNALRGNSSRPVDLNGCADDLEQCDFVRGVFTRNPVLFRRDSLPGISVRSGAPSNMFRIRHRSGAYVINRRGLMAGYGKVDELPTLLPAAS